MDGKGDLDVRVEATAELLLLASISSDLVFCIAREVEELALVGFNGHIALGEVAELLLLAINDPLRNVAGAKS